MGRTGIRREGVGDLLGVGQHFVNPGGGHRVKAEALERRGGQCKEHFEQVGLLLDRGQ